MPRLLQEEVQRTTVGSFTFSGIRPDKLGASEYTLATIVCDTTGSVSPYSKQLMECVKAAVNALKSDPKAGNILVRYVTFNSHTGIREEHGFAPLPSIDPDKDYLEPKCEGFTPLNDAAFSSIQAANKYGNQMINGFFHTVNAVTFVITDGDNNVPGASLAQIKAELETLKAAEQLESHQVLVIGINAATYAATLKNFVKEAGLTDYIDAGDASAANLRKLGNFISRSVSSTSQALGTGGPSQTLTI